MTLRFPFALFTVLLLSGCVFDSSSDKIIGNFIVIWIDLPQNQSISEQFEPGSSGSSTIIPEYVFSVGHNNDFIIAKQHPTNGFDSGYVINTRLTNYYVVDMKRKILKRGNKFFGPLTLRQFDSLRTKLGIQNILFDMNYPENY